MTNFKLFITDPHTPLRKDCLHLWLHGLSSARSCSIELDFSFSCMRDKGNEVGGVHSDFMRHLLISEEESY